MSNVNFSDATPVAPTGAINVKWQSDTSGNASANYSLGVWQNWTPTVAGTGSMSVSTGAITAEFCQCGPTCFVQYSITFTTSGTPADSITISLPIASQVNAYVSCVGWGSTGSPTAIPLSASLNGSTLEVYAGGNTTTPFAIGTMWVTGSFLYRTS